MLQNERCLVGKKEVRIKSRSVCQDAVWSINQSKRSGKKGKVREGECWVLVNAE